MYKKGSKRNADKEYMLRCRPDHSVPVQVIIQANEGVMFCAALCMQIFDLLSENLPILRISEIPFDCSVFCMVNKE